MLNDVSECSEVVIQPKECQEIKCFSFIFLNQDNRLGKYVLSPMGGDQRMGIISFFKTFHGRRMHYILLTNILIKLSCLPQLFPLIKSPPLASVYCSFLKYI